MIVVTIPPDNTAQTPTNSPTAIVPSGGQELEKTDRYQNRVIWLVPLIVVLTAAAGGLFILLTRRKS